MYIYSFNSGVTVIQKQASLMYLFAVAIFDLPIVTVEAIGGSNELGLHTLKHYCYCQDKQRLALWWLLQITAWKAAAWPPAVRLHVFNHGTKEWWMENQVEERETERALTWLRKRVSLSACVDNKKIMSRDWINEQVSVYESKALCVCEKPIYRKNKGGINMRMCMWQQERDTMCEVADSCGWVPHRLFLWEMECGNYSCDKGEQEMFLFDIVFLHLTPFNGLFTHTI